MMSREGEIPKDIRKKTDVLRGNALNDKGTRHSYKYIPIIKTQNIAK